jgi:UDP-glucose 4-epimerase
MAKWLVTGGCGFIGSHLVEALLARGDSVRILDNLSTGKRENAPAAAELMIGDVTDYAAVGRAMGDADGCFHLAAVVSVAETAERWIESHRVNQTGTITLFEAIRRSGRVRPLVYASSAAVYGDSPDLPLSEDGETTAISPYGADKRGSELHARAGWAVHRVPSAGLRFFNVYGPRQDPRSPYAGVIAIFADRLAAGLPITVYGDGQQLRDFIYVGDVVRYLLAAMDRAGAGAEVFNVCTGRGTTVLELARLIGEILGRRPEITHRPQRAGDIRLSIGAPERAIGALGFAATTALADGLRRTLNALGPAPARRSPATVHAN